MNYQDLIDRRRDLIGKMNFNHPLDVARNLGLAPNEEYEAYLKRYDIMKEELTKLNRQLGLPENSMD
jgi:hypothetical protein